MCVDGHKVGGLYGKKSRMQEYQTLLIAQSSQKRKIINNLDAVFVAIRHDLLVKKMSITRAKNSCPTRYGRRNQHIIILIVGHNTRQRKGKRNG